MQELPSGQRPVSGFTIRMSGDEETIMELKDLDASNVRLVVSLDDLGTMSNALNEVCNGFEVADFRTKMGGNEEEVERILDDIIPVYRRMEQTESPHALVRFSRFELRAIIGALKEVCRVLDPDVFSTRMGATRDEADEILDTIVPIYRKMKEAERLPEDN